MYKRQTQYYFLSGFTAKLAGTERGITEPTPTFSACFGQAFLELHPTKYAEELVKRMEANGAKAYLVNTGWNGTGKRISIKAVSYTHLDVYKRQCHGSRREMCINDQPQLCRKNGTCGFADLSCVSGSGSSKCCLLYTSRCV